MKTVRVVNAGNGAVLAENAGIASTSRARRTGLLKHTSLAPGEGLWIVPSEGVHTAGMKFAIDVIFLSRSRTVLKVCPGMPKWRLALCLRAHSVLELPAGTAEATGTRSGDQLILTTC
jgi:uncharacterized protein